MDGLLRCTQLRDDRLLAKEILNSPHLLFGNSCLDSMVQKVWYHLHVMA